MNPLLFNKFDDRFGGMAPSPITPEDLQSMLLRRSAMPPTTPGVTLPPAAPPPVEPSVNPDAPIRMPSDDAVQAWRTGVNQDIASGNTTLPSEPLPRTAVPYSGRPSVAQAPGPNGLTLDSTPAVSGWGGSIGLPSSPEQAKAFAGGQNWEKLMSAGDDVAKALKGKQASEAAAAAATINPTNTGAGVSQELAQKAGLSQGLMSDIMQKIAMASQRRPPMGISLPTRRLY